MKSKYAAMLLVGLLVGAGLWMAFCSTGEAPEGFDPTELKNETE